MKHFIMKSGFWVFTLLAIFTLLFFQNCSKVKFSQPELDLNPKVCTSLNSITLSYSQTTFTSTPGTVTVTIPSSLVLSEYTLTVDYDKIIGSISIPEINGQLLTSYTFQIPYSAPEGVNSVYHPSIILSKINDDCTREYNFTVYFNLEVIPPPAACLETSTTQDGTSTLPWRIDSCACLQAIETAPKNSLKNHNFKLTQNIDCSSFALGDGFTPIKNFSGVLDGNNIDGDDFTITNLTIRSSKASLFRGNSGTIQNIKITNATIEGNQQSVPLSPYDGQAGVFCTDEGLGFACNGIYKNINVANSNITGKQRVGGLVSTAFNAAFENITITNTNVTCTNTSPFGGVCEAGGVVAGMHEATGTILNTNFSGNLTGGRLGGITATNFGQINNTNVTAIFASTDPISMLGGIVGVQSSRGSIAATTKNSHANFTLNLSITNPVFPSVVISHAYVGGVIGLNSQAGVNSIENSSAVIDITFNTTLNTGYTQEYIGGIVGVNQAKVLNSSASGTIRYKNADTVDGLFGSNEANSTLTQGNATTVQISTLP